MSLNLQLAEIYGFLKEWLKLGIKLHLNWDALGFLYPPG